MSLDECQGNVVATYRATQERGSTTCLFPTPHHRLVIRA
jgi:hypothetical protein